VPEPKAKIGRRAGRILPPPPREEISLPWEAIQLGKDLYAAGYRAGYRAGLRAARAREARAASPRAATKRHRARVAGGKQRARRGRRN